MKHFLIVGQEGETVGLLIEVLQLFYEPESALDAQDFFSNALGSEFFDDYYNPEFEIGPQLRHFFEVRAGICK